MAGPESGNRSADFGSRDVASNYLLLGVYGRLDLDVPIEEQMERVVDTTIESTGAEGIDTAVASAAALLKLEDLTLGRKI